MESLERSLRERLEALPGPERERLARALRLPSPPPELVAVVRADETRTAQGDLLDHLRARLPGYMVPRRIVLTDALPRTPAGKLDRRAVEARVAALPRDSESRNRPQLPEAASRLPRTDAERTLAGIWASVLGSDEIFVDDDFFELGGDSLLSIRVIARAKQAGLAIDPQRFFATPTIAALASAATPDPEATRVEPPGVGDEATPDTPPALPPRPAGPAPLSFAQKGFWVLDRLDPGNPAYNVAVRIHLRGPLDRERLQESFREVLSRHDALRGTVELEDGRPRLGVLPLERFSLETEDLSERAEAEAHLEALSRETARHRFDLVGGPLVRGALCRLSSEHHALLLTFHHMVLDGESVRLVLEDLGTAYREAGSRSPGQDPGTGGAVSFRDYACWERSQWAAGKGESSLGYWRRALADVPERIEWPPDEPDPARNAEGGATLTRTLPTEFADAVAAACHQEGCTPFALLLAVYQAFLSRHTGQEVVVVGTPVGHRPHPAVERGVGYFQNMLPLRGDLRGDPTFSELVTRTRGTVAEALAHADVPFERIVETVRPERDPTTTPLFQTAFTFRDGTRPEGWRSALAVPGVEVEAKILHNGAAKFELALEVERTASGLALVVEYSTSRFRPGTVANLLDRFEVLLRGALDGLDQPVATLPIMTPEERRRSLGPWSRPPSHQEERAGSPDASAPDPTVPELVDAVARRSPDRVAVVDDRGSLTYGELVARAEVLARRFRGAGVGRDDLVAVAVAPSVDQIVAFLAAWRAGGAYLGLDPDHPPARLRAILEDATPSVVVSDGPIGGARGELAAVVPDGVPVLSPHEEPGGGAVDGDGGPSPDPRALAYVVYTSGSTGTPKGVEVEHGALANLALWHREAFSVGGDDRASQLANPAFDASVWEIWANLAAGATLVIAPEVVRADPRALRSWLEAERITACFAATPLAEVLLQSGSSPGSLRFLLTGGDQLRSRPGADWRVPLINCYGPSECGVVATAGEVAPGGGRRLPGIGRPIRGTRVFVLDRRGRPVPPGVPGELCLGGSGLARGYRGDPGKTAEAFRAGCFEEAEGARLYHTGDRVHFRSDGTLAFLGRVDRQVKIRGQRIELAEVETALLGVPGVEQAAAEVRPSPVGDQARLVAFVVAAPRETLDLTAVRERLVRTLPRAMVPTAIVPLTALPLNASGKVDRQALSRIAVPWEGGEAPQGPVERLVAGVWGEVLGAEDVGRHDDFFALGGHSLNAISVIARLEEAFGVTLPVAEFFATPTVAGLARSLPPSPPAASPAFDEASSGTRTGGAGAAATPRADGDGAPDSRHPLSPDQARLWYLQQLDPDSPAYNIPLVYRLRGPLDVVALRDALQILLERHEALRTTVDATGPEPVQVVHAASPVAIEMTTLAGDAPDARVREALEEEARAPFDLARGPLIRARLVRRGGADDHLILTLHHLIADGWSVGLLARELSRAYARRLSPSGGAETGAHQAPPHADPGVPRLRYDEWCAQEWEWVGSPASRGEVAFWTEQLRDVPPLDLPGDRLRPPQPSYRGRTHPFRLSREVAKRLEDRCRSAGVTPFVMLLAGFKAFLLRYAGQEDVSVGTVVAGRSSVGAEAVVGLFANTVVVRTRVEPGAPLDELIDRVRRSSLDALGHQRLPFARVVEAVQPPRDPSRNPLFQVAFILQNQDAPTLDLAGLEVEAVPIGTGTAKFDLTLTAQRDDDGYALYLEYATDLFEEGTIRRMATHLETLLSAMAEGYAGPVARLPLVRDRTEWSLTGPALPPSPGPLHDRFSAQARLTPDAVAVTAEDGASLRYGELDSRSTRIAESLRARGIGTGDVVGVALPRCPDLVATLLGILKAGAAYLPLDPEFPRARLRHIVEDAGSALLLTAEGLLDRFAPETPVLPLSALPEGPAPGDPLPVVAPGALAYLIYTSGSTGGPKGVEVTHGNATNLLDAMAARPGVDEETRWLAVTTLSFDISVLEIFGPLLMGGEVILASTDTAGDGAALGALIDRTDPTHLQATPSAWRMLLDSGWKGNGGLRALVGGEALPPELARDLTAPCREVWNMYGPTETTVWSTCGRVDGVEGPIQVGTPVANTTVYVLDPALQPVPQGVPGELYIAGSGVTRGYRGRPELTAERFVADPFAAGGRRMYRTGDRVRLSAGGRLEVLGRWDGQVKIRGYRIETGEVEAVMAEHPGVRRAVVKAFGTGTPDARLVAFVVPDPGRVLSGTEIRRFARERLPRYMVPSMVSILDTLPLTPNGKVDRGALPDPLESGRPPSAGHQPPASNAERTIADVWSDLLPGVRVGRNDNFFELGGHSLLSIRAVAEIRRRTGRELDPRAFFFQSVEQLAVGLEGHEDEP